MTLPSEVQYILSTLHDAGFEAFAVGGCVRDLLLHRQPADWDITTSAPPERIQTLFPNHFYNNRFGTVSVLTDSNDDLLNVIEVTTYRVDVEYSDKRHPDRVEFTRSLREDLARRDFTINAMALAGRETPIPTELSQYSATIDDMTVIDPFGGLQDLHSKLVRTVGNAGERFSEDALRLLRAVRFAAQLQFSIEEQTKSALREYAPLLRSVSQERIREEFVAIVQSDIPERGMELLQETSLLPYIIPELAEGVGIEQNKHHVYTVFEHCVKSLQFAADYDYPLHVRLAALFHDIGKPRTRGRKDGDYTFYGHDIVGARMTEKIMKRMRFSNDLTKQVRHLVRQHMFYYDVGEITEAGIRRLLSRVGKDNFDDLIKLRIAERKGSGVPKARPYRLRHLQFMAEKVAQQPISTSQLAIDGTDVIETLKVTPGPLVGGNLNALLAEVIDDPSKNTREYLLNRAAELKRKDPQELKKIGIAAVREEEKKREEEIRKKYHV